MTDIKAEITPDILAIFGKNHKWIMKVMPNGEFKFNREDFPGMTPDEFAREVVWIMEQHLRLDIKAAA